MKKIMLFAVMLSIVMNIGVFAAEDDMLGEAIINAKKVLSVPEEYNQFSYSAHGEGDEKVWMLDWSGDNGNVNATVDAEGQVINYYFYENSDKKGLTDLTEDEAKVSAEKFLHTVMPEDAADMRLKNSSGGYCFLFEYEKVVNNIPERYDTCSIGVEKYSGKVTEFARTTMKETQYQSAENIITEEEAKGKYLEKIGIKMEYADYYDYKEKKLNIFPIYMAGGKNKAISAQSGEVIDFSISDMNEKRLASGGNNLVMAAKEEAADMAYTPEEKAAMEEVAKFISEEEAAKKAAQILDFLPEGTEFAQAGLYKNDRHGTYYRNFNIKNGGEHIGNVTLEAETAGLMSFNVYPHEKSGRKIAEDEAKKRAEAFIKKYAAAEFAQTVEDEKEEYMPISAKNELPSYYSFSYVRKVNGIKYPSNRISVTYDNETGMIASYSRIWDEEAVFPDVAKTLTDRGIMDIADKILDFTLIYVKGVPVYDFKDTAGIRLDAFTGKRINYDGSEYVENKREPYTDIEGHWAEADILKLWNNNIYKSSDLFNPDGVITKKEFAEFIYGYKPSEAAAGRLFAFMPEEQADLDKPLTRADAAKAIVGKLGMERIAKCSEIFIYPFADEIAEDVKGYAAVCYALGIIRGDENGKFSPDSLVTNAQAAVMAVNIFDE